MMVVSDSSGDTLPMRGADVRAWREAHGLSQRRLAILLDVDNGPGFLVYEANRAVYDESFLGLIREALAAGGALVVWSAAEAVNLQQAMAASGSPLLLSVFPRLKWARASFGSSRSTSR